MCVLVRRIFSLGKNMIRWLVGNWATTELKKPLADVTGMEVRSDLGHH